MLKQYVANKIHEVLSREREYLDEKIKLKAKELCKEMVLEILSDQNETETISFFGYQEVQTIIAILKEGIADKVLKEFNDTHQKNAMEYVQGEEFIDKIIDRVNKKQLKQ